MTKTVWIKEQLMDKISELSYLHRIAQLEEENRLLRDEAKRLRLTIRQYLNKKNA